MRRWISVLLIVQLLFGPSAAYALHSTDEWEKFMRQQMDVVIRSQFAYLGKDFTDVELAMVLKARSRALRLREIYQELSYVKTALASTSATNGPLLRQAALERSESELLVQAQRRDAETFKRLESLRGDQCSDTRLAKFDNEMDAACLVNVTSTIMGLTNAITALNEGAQLSNPNISFQFNSYNGQFNFNQGTASTNWQNIFLNSATAAGAMIGSAFPGPGTVIGGAVGFVIGMTVCVLFGNGNGKLIAEYRQEIANIKEALGRLTGPASKAIVKNNCDAIFSNAESVEPLRQMRDRMQEATALSEQVATGVEEMAKTIEAEKQTQLELLVRDDLRTFEKRFELAFKRYLDSRAQASRESKSYFAQKVEPTVVAVQNGRADEGAREQLWSDLITGDARFTSDGAFCFEVGEPHAEEMLYWGPASRAPVRYLREAQ